MTTTLKGNCSCAHSQSALSLGQFSVSQYSVVLKQDADTITERAAISRQRSQLMFIARMKAKVLRVLRIQEKEAVDRIKQGMHPVPTDYQTRWSEQLYFAEIKDGMGAFRSGYSIAQSQMEMLILANTKEVTSVPLVPFVGAGQGDDFLLSPTEQRVSQYFRATSTKQAKTHADQIDSIFEWSKNNLNINPDTGRAVATGLNPIEIANISNSMQGWSKNYSNLVARTGTVWAHNEGAQERYIQSGVVTHKRWYATADERTCPFCAELHNTVVGVSSSFAGAGEELTGIAENANGELVEQTMTLPDWETEHPPVHPMCRCTIIPEIKDITLTDLEIGRLSDPIAIPQAGISTVPDVPIRVSEGITEAGEVIPR